MVTQWQRRNYSRKYGCSCVELRPLASDENERHQLAAHCAYGMVAHLNDYCCNFKHFLELGSPILGDTKYKKLSTLWAAARGSPLGATSRSARRLPEIEQNLYLHHRSITFEGSMGKVYFVLFVSIGYFANRHPRRHRLPVTCSNGTVV